MHQVQDLVVKYLDQARQMQVATSVNNVPWIATVYFAHDNLHNLFWISKPDRRHSKELIANPKVAGAIVIEQKPGEPVRGVQFQGTARDVTNPEEIRKLFLAYGERYDKLGITEDIISGKNPHHLYEVEPELFVLFDEVNFPDQPRQEWHLTTTATQ